MRGPAGTRAAVEALLAAHEKSGNILDRPPAQTVDSGPGQARPDAGLDPTSGPDDARAPATKTADYRPISETGIVIAGHYTLQQKIGEGGMGEVWVAKQTEPVKRKVALEADQDRHGFQGGARSASSKSGRRWR